MRTQVTSFVTILSLIACEAQVLDADAVKRPNATSTTHSSSFEPFTGKTTRNRVRMRAGADLNSPILRELDQGDLVGVIGEEDTFYAVKPPKEIKAYIYRTYVLDNTVDGTQVNVRLEPNLESPIIAQLNKGDKVDGKVSALNSQWMEISLPQSVKFYIAKDFVEKSGPAELYGKAIQRREEAKQLVSQAYVKSQVELQKPQEQVQLDGVIADLKRAVTQYADVPEAASQAKTYLASIEGSYQQRQANLPAIDESEPEPVTEPDAQTSENLTAWLPKESKLFEAWLQDHPQSTMDDFYADQRADAIQLRGIIQPYLRPVKNKPGNYLLLNHVDNQPIAFLYSTQVDLKPKSGQVVNLVALSRPNNNFAFPTFFVLSAQ